MSEKTPETAIKDLETAYNRMLCEMNTNRYEFSLNCARVSARHSR